MYGDRWIVLGTRNFPNNRDKDGKASIRKTVNLDNGEVLEELANFTT